MDKIPIKFDYAGRHYEGYFSAVAGSGANHYHLMINNFYKGQLFYSEKYGWQFYEGFKGMQEFFGNYIIAWHE